ncbi:hypothetical protein WA026_013678 [Henosepilachna vigintioctopunctata]|uniref:PARP catalytic domain-containing protein n=1 Tax=Henosepilachna vigintioctopunctata TaxID=420089 RepID=A0AAW1UXL0_9CUCU
MIRRRYLHGSPYDESYFPYSEPIVPKRDNIYELEEVYNWTDEYDTIMSKIDSDIFKVTRIERVKNTFLEKAFELRKKQYPEQGVKQLFHITKPKAANSICKHNFNWRLFGKSSNHHSRGQGVYFATSSEHAATFFQKRNDQRVIFLVDVLVGSICVGKKAMSLPSDSADSSVDKIKNYESLVKYEDNVFYPSYKITFTFKGNSENQIARYQRPQAIDSLGNQADTDSSKVLAACTVTAAVVGAGLLGLYLYKKHQNNRRDNA